MANVTPLLGEDGLSPDIQPVEAAFRAVLNRFRQVDFFSKNDEETITGAFLGGLTTVFPFCATLFRAPVSPERCCWGHFRKSGQSGASEAEVGADFALVVYQTDSIARLALFQAKKVDERDAKVCIRDQSRKDLKVRQGFDANPFVAPGIPALEALQDVPKEAWVLDVHRRPKRPEKKDEVWREAQLLKLTKFGEVLAKKVSLRAHGIIKKLEQDLCAEGPQKLSLERFNGIKRALEKTSSDTSFKSLDWVHYLAYASGRLKKQEVPGAEAASVEEGVASANGDLVEKVQEVVCVPMCDLGEARWRENVLSAETFTSNWVDLSAVHCYRFMDILREGIRDISLPGRPSSGWITVDNNILGEHLRELMALTTVFIADDQGGSSGLPLELQEAIVQVTVEPISGLDATSALDGSPARGPGM